MSTERESEQLQAEGPEEEITCNRGGKRRGAGRKRKYEGGYGTVKYVFWKTISIHFEVFEEWVRERDRRMFKNNSDFAKFLLANSRDQEQSLRESAQTRRHERVFLDTIVSEAATQTSMYCNDGESDSEGDSGDDVSYETSSASSDEDFAEELLPAVKDELMCHDIQDGDQTVHESVDMDIASELGELPIETNIPAMPLSHEQQQTIQGAPSKVQLLPNNYVDEIKAGVIKEVNMVMERKVICCRSKIHELFQFCMDATCLLWS